MDHDYSLHDNMERILQNPRTEPCDIPFYYLRDITNNFAADRELGKGGFGVVYMGMLSNGERIAVKYLLSTTQCHEKQFKNEVDNLMKVRHKNVVQFRGYCYETSLKCMKYNGVNIFAEKSPERLLCFEYMANGSLDNYISEELCGLAWHQRYKIIKGICCGLYYLHDECQINSFVIHLDLKPENILLDDNMVPKIADFGLAKLFDDNKTHTCATSRVGSMGYMAPEYIFEGIISPMADIYSLGVIIVQMITGRKLGPSGTEAFCSDFVGPVLQNWRNRLIGENSISLETECQQIRECLEIGISCTDYDRRKRPTARTIYQTLDTGKSTDFYVREILEAEQDVVTEKDLDHLLQLLDSKESGGAIWECLMERTTSNMTYKAWRREREVGPTMYCSSTIFEDATPELVRDFFWDLDFRLKWDSMVAWYKTLDEFPQNGTTIVHLIKKFPFFCSDREYIFGGRIWESGETYYCVTKGVPYPSLPKKQKPRRVDLYFSSWRIRVAQSLRNPGQLSACECTLVHYEDLGIPEEIAKLGVRHGMWATVKNVLSGFRAYQQMRDTENTLSRSAIMARVTTKISFAGFDDLLDQGLSVANNTSDENDDSNTVQRGFDWKRVMIGGAVAAVVAKVLLLGAATKQAKQ